jgi:hypothetical protein
VHRIAFLQQFINFGGRWSGHAQQRGLNFEIFIEREIGAVHQYGRAGRLRETSEAADVVDVSVRADDGADLEVIARENRFDALDFVAGVDDERFAGFGVAQYVAIALKHTDRQGFVN